MDYRSRVFDDATPKRNFAAYPNKRKSFSSLVSMRSPIGSRLSAAALRPAVTFTGVRGRTTPSHAAKIKRMDSHIEDGWEWESDSHVPEAPKKNGLVTPRRNVPVSRRLFGSASHGRREAPTRTAYLREALRHVLLPNGAMLSLLEDCGE